MFRKKSSRRLALGVGIAIVGIAMLYAAKTRSDWFGFVALILTFGGGAIVITEGIWGQEEE